MTRLTLSEHISRLRSQASSIYDMAKAQGMSTEKIAEVVRPISKMLKKIVKDSTLAQKCFAIKSLQNQVRSYEMDIQFLQQKILDSQDHIEMLNNSIKEEMKHQGVETLEDNGYNVTSIDGKINVR